MAAFPLGTALLPGMALPLRIFEPRYRTMVEDLMGASDPSFVVALIERGSEVGGGDERSSVGCLARILRAEPHGDGTWTLLAVGTDRVRVIDWLEDSPYPRARVEPWPDDDLDAADAAVLSDRVDQLELAVLDLVALATSLGLPHPEHIEFSSDLFERVHQLAIVSPIGAHDRQRLLCADGPVGRVELLELLVEEQQLLLRARRELGDEPDA